MASFCVSRLSRFMLRLLQPKYSRVGPTSQPARRCSDRRDQNPRKGAIPDLGSTVSNTSVLSTTQPTHPAQIMMTGRAGSRGSLKVGVALSAASKLVPGCMVASWLVARPCLARPEGVWYLTTPTTRLRLACLALAPGLEATLYLLGFRVGRCLASTAEWRLTEGNSFRISTMSWKYSHYSNI